MGFWSVDLLSGELRPRVLSEPGSERRVVAKGRARVLCLLGLLALAAGAACNNGDKKSDAGGAPDAVKGEVFGQGGATGTGGSPGYDALADGNAGPGDARDGGTAVGGTGGMGAGGTGGTGGTGGSSDLGGSSGKQDALGGEGGSSAVDASAPQTDGGATGGVGGSPGQDASSRPADGSATGGSDGGGDAKLDALSTSPVPDAAVGDTQGGGGGGRNHIILSPSVAGGILMVSPGYRLVAGLTSGMASGSMARSQRYQLQSGFVTKSE